MTDQNSPPRKPSGMLAAVRETTKKVAEHLNGGPREAPTDPPPLALCGRLPLTPTLAPCELDSGHVGPCRHRAIARPKPSESQQIRAVEVEHDQARDALANMRATLGPDDHHGRMLAMILERQLDSAQLQSVALARLARIEGVQRDERDARSALERRVQELETLVDGASVGGSNG